MKTLRYSHSLVLAVVTLLFFVGSVKSQAPANAPKFKEAVQLFTTNQEGAWTGIVYRTKTVPLTLIPEGATDNTWVDYWMEGHYVTQIRSDGEIYLEVSITLHVPTFTSNAFYMIWLQLYNDKMTKLKDDFHDYYESYACTIAHSTKAIKSSANGKVDQSEVYRAGYRGKTDFIGVQGLYTDIALADYTVEHPWYQDFQKTLILQPGQKKDGGTVTCTQDRQFRTIYSDIDVFDWTILKGRFGFKEYTTAITTDPWPKGYVQNIEFMVIDSAQSSIMTALIGLIFLATSFGI